MASEINIGTPRSGSVPPAYDFSNVWSERGRDPNVGGGAEENEGERRSRRRAREGSVAGEG